MGRCAELFASETLLRCNGQAKDSASDTESQVGRQRTTCAPPDFFDFQQSYGGNPYACTSNDRARRGVSQQATLP